MHIEDLRAFLAIARTGSLTAAAKALAVPKSTIGRRLSRLEEDLDAHLVIRTPRHTQLTDLGLRLAQGGESAVAMLDELRRSLKAEGSEPRGVLRVSAPQDLTILVMGGLCGRYLARHPRVDLHLHGSNRVVDLVADGYDVVFRVHFAPLPAVGSIKVRRLGTIEVGPYAAPSYLQAHGQPRRPEELRRHRCLSMTSLGPAWVLTTADAKRVAKVEIDAALSSNDNHALCDAACEGAGIAVLPSFLAAAAVTDGRLARVLPSWCLQTATLSMLWPATHHASPRVRAFLALAVELFESLPLGRAREGRAPRGRAPADGSS